MVFMVEVQMIEQHLLLSLSEIKAVHFHARKPGKCKKAQKE